MDLALVLDVALALDLALAPALDLALVLDLALGLALALALDSAVAVDLALDLRLVSWQSLNLSTRGEPLNLPRVDPSTRGGLAWLAWLALQPSHRKTNGNMATETSPRRNRLRVQGNHYIGVRLMLWARRFSGCACKQSTQEVCLFAHGV